MGIPLTIQENDNFRIEHLKKDFNFAKKIDVIRAGLSLLEQEVTRMKKVKKWKNAARLVSNNSAETNKIFQPNATAQFTKL